MLLAEIVASELALWTLTEADQKAEGALSRDAHTFGTNLKATANDFLAVAHACLVPELNVGSQDMTTPARAGPAATTHVRVRSGRKYKVCHLDDDLAKASAQREAEHQAALEEGEADLWPHYHPHTHKVPAARRPDFLVVVRNLAMKTGDEARLVIHQPSDLGRDQASVDQAIAFLRDNRVQPDFLADPPPPVIAATQELLDRVLGRGVCVAAQSGYRLRRYGRTELVLDEGGGSFTVYVSGRAMAGVVRALHLAIQQDAAALGIDERQAVGRLVPRAPGPRDRLQRARPAVGARAAQRRARRGPGPVPVGHGGLHRADDTR